MESLSIQDFGPATSHCCRFECARRSNTHTNIDRSRRRRWFGSTVCRIALQQGRQSLAPCNSLQKNIVISCGFFSSLLNALFQYDCEYDAAGAHVCAVCVRVRAVFLRFVSISLRHSHATSAACALFAISISCAETFERFFSFSFSFVRLAPLVAHNVLSIVYLFVVSLASVSAHRSRRIHPANVSNECARAPETDDDDLCVTTLFTLLQHTRIQLSCVFDHQFFLLFLCYRR